MIERLKRSETVHSFGAAALALALRLTPQEVTFQFGSQKEAPAAHPKSMFWFSTKLSMIVLGASDSFEDFHCNQQPINSQKPVPFLCLVQLMGGKKNLGHWRQTEDDHDAEDHELRQLALIPI